MDKDVIPLPRAAIVAFVGLIIAAFLVSLLAPAFYPEQPSLLGLPFAVIALIWIIPLGAALMRGEPWAFIIALALLIFLTDSTFRARNWADKSLDAQVLIKAIVWLVCGLVGLMRIMGSGWILGRPPVVFTLFFLAMLLASALWSPVPLYTVQSAVAYSWMFLFGLAAAQVLDERQFLQAIALGTGLIVLPSLAMAPFTMGITPPSPGSTSTADRLRGLTDHPIPMAEVAALFTFAVASLWARARGSGKLGFALLVLMGAATAALTQSRIPPLAMLASVGAFWAYRRGGWLLMAPTLTLFVILFFATESLGGIANILPADLLELVSRSGQSSEILSMSGRLDIWPYVIDRIADSPVLGHGHASGMALFKSFMRWNITHTHNLYLQALLYTGIVGFTLLMGVLLCQLRMFFTAPCPARDILVLYVMLKGMTEQSILSNMPSGTVAVWMVTVGMAAMAWRRRPAAATARRPIRQPAE